MVKAILSQVDIRDTIAAISTPIGYGGIGIIRLSGKDAIKIAAKVFRAKCKKPVQEFLSNCLYYGHLRDPQKDTVLDEGLLVVMREPKSYTRQDVVEIQMHSSPVVLKEALEVIIKQGARAAKRGEFTKRAFLNGRIDLTRAEAVIETINAKNRKGLEIQEKKLQGKLQEKIEGIIAETELILAGIETEIEFCEETDYYINPEDTIERIRFITNHEIQGLIENNKSAKIFLDGIRVAIAGRPNAGKSTLLNRLVAKNKAIVSDIAGTTRDLIEEYILIDQIPIYLIDTAGIQDSKNSVEKLGINLALDAIKSADLVLFMIDATNPEKSEVQKLIKEIKAQNLIMVVNKIDIKKTANEENHWIKNFGWPTVEISAKNGSGIKGLIKKIKDEFYAGVENEKERGLVPNLRQAQHLEKAQTYFKKAENILLNREEIELAGIELKEAIGELEAIVGKKQDEGVLNKIFEEFCVGK